MRVPFFVNNLLLNRVNVHYDIQFQRFFFHRNHCNKTFLNVQILKPSLNTSTVHGTICTKYTYTTVVCNL